MYALERLSLTDNELTARGIRQLTLTTRVAGRGPNRLHELDLSMNCRLNEESLGFLTSAFKTIDCLNLNNTAIRDTAHLPLHRVKPVDNEKPNNAATSRSNQETASGDKNAGWKCACHHQHHHHHEDSKVNYSSTGGHDFLIAR